MNAVVYWLIGIVLAMFGIGLGLFYQGRYLLAPESEKLKRAKEIKNVGIWWLVIGVIYLIVVLLLIALV